MDLLAKKKKRHTENTNQIETLAPLYVNKMCCFSHVRTSDSIKTYRTGCPSVWPRPAWCHPPALPWDATENENTKMIDISYLHDSLCYDLAVILHAVALRCLRECPRWFVLFLVPGTTDTVKTALRAVWSSCNILYGVYKQIPDTELKEAFTRFHFMPTDPFTCYTLGRGVWMLSLWFTAHKSAQVLSARTVWTRCIISHILVNTRPVAQQISE